jgi:hypothetical protein
METGTKHSPWFLLEHEILLQLSAVHFLALLLQENVDPERKYIAYQ